MCEEKSWRFRRKCTRRAGAFGIAISVTAASVGFGSARADDAASKATALIQSSTQAAEKFLRDPEWEALRNVLGGARAILIVPHDIAGGFLITASGGDGILLRRHGQDWSDPVFMHVRTVGVGLAVGAESQSILTMVMTDAGVDSMISGVSQVGGSGSVALADLGVGGGGSGGSLSGGLQVLTVSTAKGLYAGSDIRGTKISAQQAYNAAVYGSGFDIGSTVAGMGGGVPAASDLRAILSNAVAGAWGQ